MARAGADHGAPLLQMRGITVRFGRVAANDDVDLAVRAGEIHALLGENGAGKTTLMRVLAGLLEPQAGQIAIAGNEVRLRTALDAARLGIGMVHQHFMLVPTLTVAQNVCLGLARAGRIFPDLKRVDRELRELAERNGLQIEPGAIVGDLSVAGQQRVEIVKVLYRGARILVFDEPTAVLAPQEVAGLIAVLQRLAAQGAAIVFISHKLPEVMALCHSVTVLRHGRVVASRRVGETSGSELSRLMVGQEIGLPRLATEDADPLEPSPPVVLQASGLSVRDERGIAKLDGVDIEVHAGEIVGVAGVDGNGQHDLAEALVGLRAAAAGQILLNGEDVTHAPTGRRIALGLAHIPEDRHRSALVEALPIRDNAVMELIGQPPFARRGWISRREVDEAARRLIDLNDIRCTGSAQLVGELSGGNQQKIVLGRAMMREPRAIVAVQPTRGLDIGATAFVHRQLLERRARGSGIMLISTELDEVLALSDRIVVLFGGRVAGMMRRAEVSVERLGMMMTGRAA